MQSDDVETAQTVTFMDEIAAAESTAPAVIGATHEALDQAGLDQTADPLAITQAVYWWLKRTIRYVPTPGTSPLVDQTLIEPTAVLAMPEPIGDCPQFSMLAAAMLRVCCINSLFVTIAAEPKFPDQWSHIYNTVEVRPGRFLPFDSSNGPEPGAEFAKPFKRRVWPRVKPAACSPTKENRPMLRTVYAPNPNRRGMRNRALRGTMGTLQCDTDGNCYDDGTNVTGNLTLDEINASAGPGDCAYGSNGAGCNPAAFMPGLTPGGTAPSGPNTASVLTTLINDAAGIAAPLVRSATQASPYYVTNPATGQAALYNPNTGTFAAATSALGSISPTVLVLGALFVGGLALFSGKK